MRPKLITVITVFILSAQLSWSQIPETISYQGILTDGSSIVVPDGSYNLMFVLYDSETNGSAVWMETHLGVAISKGVFNVILGSVNSLSSVEFDQQYWLGITVGAGPEMTPRTRLTASSYSLNSRSVADGAVTEDKIAGNAVTSEKIENNAVTTDHIQNGTIAAEDVGFDYAGSTSPAGPATDLVSSGAVDTTDLADDAVIGDKIADGQIVRSINGKMDDVSLLEGANIAITPGLNSLTISSTDTTGNDWKLAGNAGTSPSTNFLGTTDDTPLELWVNNSRVLRLEPNATSPNVIGGFSGNNITSGALGVTICGGGKSQYANSVTANGGTIGGGLGNTASNFAVVGGGYINTASGVEATVGGGLINTASGDYATVGGGLNNGASGYAATAPGGSENIALGDYSFAAGRNANANHPGSFVFADSGLSATFSSIRDNEFAVRCIGGARFYSQWTPSTAGVWLPSGGAAWSGISDRNAKANFTQVDGHDTLKRLMSIPIETWNYQSQDPSIRHIGPMAQDFYAAFGLGENDRYINTVDVDGVALAAIQGLYEVVKEKDAENAKLRAEVDDLKERMAALEESLLSHNQK